MLRLIPIMVALVLPFQSALAAAVPLQPTGKWQVNYADIACTAERQYGPYRLAFQPSPLGRNVRLVIEGPGRAEKALQFPSELTVSASDRITSSSLIYPLKGKGRRGLQTFVPTDDFARVLNREQLTIIAGTSPDKQLMWDLKSPNRMGVDFILGPSAALSLALEKCMVDLRQHWGLVDGTFPEAKVRPVASGSIQGIFKSDDYPAEAMRNRQTGRTRYLLMIDQIGKVIDCVVVESSGVATLDAMGCQVIRERAKFNPAVSNQGKPVASTYVTPLIAWVLAR